MPPNDLNEFNGRFWPKAATRFLLPECPLYPKSSHITEIAVHVSDRGTILSYLVNRLFSGDQH